MISHKVSSVINTGRINELFQMINTGTQYTTPILIIIPDIVPLSLLLMKMMLAVMMNLKRTGFGPNGFPY